MPTAQLDTQLTWMQRHHMAAVLEIENHSFDYTWTRFDFHQNMQKREVIGTVAVRQDRIVGFMVHEFGKYDFHILKLAVHQDYRRCGIGTELVQRLKSRLALIGGFNEQPISRIVTETRESNLDAQLFFRSVGFRAIGIQREFYDDNREDAYVMFFKQEGI